jgi:16S rRNA (cytidine1402-2'-O)-methyltransferase
MLGEEGDWVEVCAMDDQKLYMVGPVGAEQDLTLRAREVLGRAGLVVAWDEGWARGRLEGLGSEARLLASGDEGALAQILEALAEGEVAWLVRELDDLAGTAQALVRALLDRGVELVSVPGGSERMGGLAASGLPADRFTALGALPGSPAQRVALWRRYAGERLTLVCEARGEELGEVLGEAAAHLGARRVAICQGEEVWRGPVSEADTSGWAGRVTLAIEGAGAEPEWTRQRVLEEVRAMRAAGASARDAVREVARRAGWPRRQVYELALSASCEEE